MLGYPIPRWFIIVGLAALVALGLAGLSLRQKTVTVLDSGRTLTLHTQAATVGEALQAAGWALYPEDIVQPDLNTPVTHEMAIRLDRAAPVEITEGGLGMVIRTHQQKIGAIIAEAGKTLGPGDAVYADGRRLLPEQLDAPGPVPHTILIRRAMPVTIVDGAGSQTVTTAALTPGEALADANIALYVADGVTPPLASWLDPGDIITIQRSMPIAVEVDGRTLQTRTHRSTVAEVLADAGLTLLGGDYVLPALDALPPGDGTPIRVVRVVEQIVTETTPLAYETQYQAIAEVEIDNTQVLQAGSYGSTATRVRVRYENGVEVSRTPEDSWVAVAPQPRIIGYGTRIVVRTLDTPDGPIEYWRAVRMYATSYSAARAGTPRSAPWYGRTRSGKVLTIGMVAIDLRVMPLGTRLYVPGYGNATAEDTGGGVKGKMIDLGFDDWNYVGWHQFLTVYFLTPVPPADQIKWVIP